MRLKQSLFLYCRFLYCDQCNIADIDIALSLVYASKKYMLTNLTDTAVKYLSEHITADNVCVVLEKCSKLDEALIVDKCVQFLQSHASCVVKKDSFVALSKGSLKFLLESDSMCVLESDLLEGVLRWGKKKVKKESGQSTPALVIEKVKDLLPMIRFPLIPYKTLQTFNAKYGILSSSDMVELFEIMTGKVRPHSSSYCSGLRGHSSAVRFSIMKDFQLSSLVKREESVKRKFTLKFKPLKANMVVFAVTIMSGPYLIRMAIHEPGGQLVSYTEKDMRDWPESDCCQEICMVLQEPIVCQNYEDPYDLEVFISHSSHMYWYDNVIQGKYTENNDLKLKYSNPEIISQLHFIFAK